MSPATGCGTVASFETSFTDANGQADITATELMIGTSTASEANACYAVIDRAAGTVSLRNNEGTAWLGPENMSGGATLENSQCVLDTATTTVTGAGDTVTASYSLAFKSTFAGQKILYLRASDAMGASTGWSDQGDWTVPTDTVPGTLSVTPASGSGAGPQVFKFRFFDSSGYADIPWTQMLIGTSSNSGMQVCYLHYSASTELLHVSTDSGLGGWLASGAPGGMGTLSNGQCSVDLSGASVTESGALLELTLPITFSYSDSNGWENLRIVNGMIRENLSSTTNACYFTVYRTLDRVYLMNDQGTSFSSYVTMGSAERAENSQCRISGTGAGASGSLIDLVSH